MEKTFFVTFSAILLSAVVTGSMLLIVFGNSLSSNPYVNLVSSRHSLAIKSRNFVLNGKNASSEFRDEILNIVKENRDIMTLFPNGFNITFVQFLANVSVDTNGKIDVQVAKVHLLLSSKYAKAVVIVDTLQRKVDKIIKLLK